MQYSIPLDTTDWVDQKQNKRQFIFFDERFTIHLWFNKDPRKPDDINQITLGNFTVWINEAILIQGSTLDYFRELSKNHWVLKENICSKYFFKSNVVMNNGYDNVIKFQVKYQVNKDIFIESGGSTMSTKRNIESTTQQLSDSSLIDDPDDSILPSFEPIYVWDNMRNTTNLKQNMTIQDNTQQIKEISDCQNIESHSLEFQYPIYSLLNMRLRNFHLKSQYCILTSLDFQTSRSLTHLCNKYSIPLGRTHFKFDLIKLELVNKESINKHDSHIEIEPIKGQRFYNEAKDKSLLIVYPYDSFSMAYKLPPPLISDNVYQIAQDFNDNENIDIKPHRVRITLKYLVDLDKGLKFNILTEWETDVTIRRKLNGRDPFTGSNTGQLIQMPSQANGNNMLLNNTPTLSRISTISLSSIAKFNNGTIVNANQNRYSGYKAGQFVQQQQQQQQITINPNNSNIKFKFINDTMTSESGNKFILRLQITNMSSQPLDSVIYYNNQSPTLITQSINLRNNGLQTLEKKTTWIQRQRQMTEGLILLSNDYKVPIINPHESYFVDLSFVAIRPGYYSTLNALKLIDLKTQECIEIGRAVSVLVK